MMPCVEVFSGGTARRALFTHPAPDSIGVTPLKSRGFFSEASTLYHKS